VGIGRQENHSLPVLWKDIATVLLDQRIFLHPQGTGGDGVILPYLLSGENVTFYQRVVESGYRLALPPKEATE
jgi:hypothetical protein